MNKHNKSLGKSSTNTASLSNAISSIKSSISPVIVTGAASGAPKPLKVPGQMWIPRTTRVFLESSTVPADASDCTIAKIFTDSGITGQIRVLGLKVWNYTPSGDNSNYVKVFTSAGMTETAVTTTVEDIGNAMHLAGVSVIIPRTIASNLVTASTPLFSVFGAPTGSVYALKQRYVADVHFEYKTNVSN